jgi:hypothetical protein
MPMAPYDWNGSLVAAYLYNNVADTMRNACVMQSGIALLAQSNER